MSTFVEVRPTVHETLTTTMVRLDDDFRVTIREESPDKDSPSTIVVTDIQRNYSGMEDGDYTTAVDPIEFVNVTKLGTDERCVIAVKCYHPENEANLVPPAGIYWWNVETHYNFYGPVDRTKTRAADPTFEGTAQAFPQIIFNNSDLTARGALPVGNTVATAWVDQRLYARLGSTEARRSHIKNNIRSYIDDPSFSLYVAGVGGLFITDASTNMARSRRLQSFLLMLEMVAMAISVDVNLNTEQKFNLLNGMTTLERDVVASRIDRMVNGESGQPRPLSTDRSAWTFRRLGNVNATSPFTYTEPTAVTISGLGLTWNVVEDSTLINLSGFDVGGDWVNYVRS